MSLRVESEVGRLHQVIVHRPGLELERLTPDNMGELLFDELLWAARAREEHDAFTDVLRGAGVQVHHLDRLLRETLAVPEAKAYVLDRVLDERTYGPMAIDPLRELFEGLDDDELTTVCIAGISKREVLARPTDDAPRHRHDDGR